MATASVTDSPVAVASLVSSGRTRRTSVSSVTAAATEIAPYPTVYRWVIGSRSTRPWCSSVRSRRQAVLRLILHSLASSRTVGGVALAATDFSSAIARSTAWIRWVPGTASPAIASSLPGITARWAVAREAVAREAAAREAAAREAAARGVLAAAAAGRGTGAA